MTAVCDFTIHDHYDSAETVFEESSTHTPASFVVGRHSSQTLNKVSVGNVRRSDADWDAYVRRAELEVDAQNQ